jgi:hypothetical protein
MEISSFQDLESRLDEFNKHHPRPHGILDLTPPLDTIPGTKASWPSNGQPGVYIFLDDQKQINYIGKASDDIALRLTPRFDTKWNSKSSESEGCRYIATIPLPKKVGFEASAIEEYLLMRLNTKFNKVHNTR